MSSYKQAALSTEQQQSNQQQRSETRSYDKLTPPSQQQVDFMRPELNRTESFVRPIISQTDKDNNSLRAGLNNFRSPHTSSSMGNSGSGSVSRSSSHAYTWHNWEIDYEDTIWSLFWAISKTVEDNKLQLLDEMEFSDFMRFCRKLTSEPRPPTYNPDHHHEYNEAGDVESSIPTPTADAAAPLEKMTRTRAYSRDAAP